MCCCTWVLTISNTEAHLVTCKILLAFFFSKMHECEECMVPCIFFRQLHNDFNLLHVFDVGLTICRVHCPLHFRQLHYDFSL